MCYLPPRDKHHREDRPTFLPVAGHCGPRTAGSDRASGAQGVPFSRLVAPPARYERHRMAQNGTDSPMTSDHCPARARRAVVERGRRGARARWHGAARRRLSARRPRPISHHRGANALRQVQPRRPRPEAGRARLRLRRTGRARPIRLRRRLPTGLLQRRPPRRRGRLRHRRVGGRAAVVERPRRHGRKLLRRLDPDGAGPHPPAAPGRDDAPGDRGQPARPRDERGAPPRQGALVERRHPVARPEAAQGRPLGAAHRRTGGAALDGARPGQVAVAPAADGHPGRRHVRHRPPLEEVAGRPRGRSLRLRGEALPDRGPRPRHDRLVRPADRRDQELHRPRRERRDQDGPRAHQADRRAVDSCRRPVGPKGRRGRLRPRRGARLLRGGRPLVPRVARGRRVRTRGMAPRRAVRDGRQQVEGRGRLAPGALPVHQLLPAHRAAPPTPRPATARCPGRRPGTIRRTGTSTTRATR